MIDPRVIPPSRVIPRDRPALIPLGGPVVFLTRYPTARYSTTLLDHAQAIRVMRGGGLPSKT